MRAFGATEVVGDELRPSWNVAPTQRVRIVTESVESDGVVRVLRSARWGLVPSWAKDRSIGARLINARSETVTVKPSFRAAAVRRRALVPAEGYYEWQKTAAGKAATFLFDPESAVVGFAGLYELWPDPTVGEDEEGRWLWSTTIITRPAPDAIGHIHDRSPVIVPEDMFDDWLDPTELTPGRVDEMLAAMPPPALEPRRVGAAVGNVRNNGPDLIEPLDVFAPLIGEAGG